MQASFHCSQVPAGLQLDGGTYAALQEEDEADQLVAAQVLW